MSIHKNYDEELPYLNFIVGSDANLKQTNKTMVTYESRILSSFDAMLKNVPQEYLPKMEELCKDIQALANDPEAANHYFKDNGEKDRVIYLNGSQKALDIGADLAYKFKKQ